MIGGANNITFMAPSGTLPPGAFHDFKLRSTTPARLWTVILGHGIIRTLPPRSRMWMVSDAGLGTPARGRGYSDSLSSFRHPAAAAAGVAGSSGGELTPRLAESCVRAAGDPGGWQGLGYGRGRRRGRGRIVRPMSKTSG